MKKRPIVRVLAAGLTAALLCSCTKATQGGESGGAVGSRDLRISDGSGDFPTLNPHLFTELSLGFITQLTQAYLIKWDSHNAPFGELASEVPTLANGGISKDGDTITYHLRRGVRWSDGAPFDADDVIFSTRAVLNPANNEVGRDGWNLITKIDEPDKYTVIYHLKHPYSSFLPAFFGSAGANPDVLPKHLLARYPNINNVPYNALPVGIGPFRITRWKRGESVEMEANPYYFRGVPRLQHVTYKLIPSHETLITQMQTGEVDLWPLVPSANVKTVLGISGVQTTVSPGTSYEHLDFNVSHPIVGDLRVREAIRYAIDRPTLAEKITHGYSVVQESLVPLVNPIAPRDIPLVAYDPKKAKALLDAAGWNVGPDGIRVKNGQRLSLQFPYYTGSAAADDTVEFIRSALKGIGIELQTRQFAPAVFFAPPPNGIIYGGHFDVTLYGWQTTPDSDISSLWECNQIPPNGQDMERFCNKELDSLLEQFKLTYDQNLQRQILDKEVKIIVANVPTIVLYFFDNAFSYNKNVKNFHPGAWTQFDQVQDLDI